MNHWPISVAVLEDESISSWLIRSALENGCDPLVLTGLIWPGWRVWTTDIDRGIPDEQLSIISAASGIKTCVIQQAALSHEVSVLSPEGLPKQGIWPWVQGLGARNRSYRGGLQYCPCCLKEDSQPYFRRYWRFSWNTGCLQHSEKLLDRCPQCLKPVEPQRLEAIRSIQLSDCASCGFDLRHSSSERALQNAQQFQRRAFSTMSNAMGEIAGKPVPVDDWFKACRHLIGIIRRCTNSPDSMLTQILNESGVDTCTITPESLNLQLELLPVSVRESLLASLEQLLCNLEFFAENLKGGGALASSVLGRNGHLPSALKLLTEQLDQGKRPKIQDRQRFTGKPKSKTTVLKAWARLKRKYGIE